MKRITRMGTTAIILLWFCSTGWCQVANSSADVRNVGSRTDATTVIPWKHPLVKKGKLGSPLVEVTPFVFADRLYLLENWQKQWEFPGSPDGSRIQEDEVRIRDVEVDRIVSIPLVGHGLGMALVFHGRVYVFAGDWGKGEKWNITEIKMTSSADLTHWTEPVVVLKAEPQEKFFNVSVCRGKDRFALLVESNDPAWPAFTFKYFVSDDLRNWTRVPDAIYGRDKYVGGPALYFEDGTHYTVYLHALGAGRYETRITRSTDLVHWQDAPPGRPFVTFDPNNKVHPLRPADIRETNASDVELCYWRGKTLVYFTGGDQHLAGDLQLAEFAGTPAELFRHFFAEPQAAAPTTRHTYCVRGSAAVESHAAEEFGKYAEAITGTKVSIVTDAASLQTAGGLVISIGRTPLLARLESEGILHVPAGLGDEGFMVKSVRHGGRQVLVLVGGSPASTLYAVYGYLEKVCKVGFFADGENIPRLVSLPDEDINILEKPRWPIRQYMMDCNYTSYWWGWSEWKQEADWAAKNRFNLLSSSFDFTSTWRKVWKDFGVDVPPSELSPPPFNPWAAWHQWDMRPGYPEAFQDTRDDLCRRFTEYGRSLGIKMAPDCVGFLGQVPRSFHQVYKDKARFFDVPWIGKDRPGKFIDPTDPLYVKVWQAYLKEYTARFGTDHYYAGNTFCEMVPGKTPEDQELVKIENATRAIETIRSVDPKGVIFTTSWTWVDKKLWSRESVRQYLDIFPQDTLLIWEQWEDRYDTTVPMYKELDYYSGKNWLLGFLHSMGGNTTLHGNLAGLIKRVQEASADPRADKCQGISLQPEAMRHNYIFFDLLSRLGWNPDGITLDAYLQDYSVRRYGKASAPKMVKCLEELAASVYSTNDVTGPLYQVRPTSNWVASVRGHAPGQGVARRRGYLPHLRNALEIALSESDKLSGSPLYQHDLVDIARQYLGDLFNVHAMRMLDAFKAGDREAFEKQAAVCERILAKQEQLLSSSDDFCLQPILDKAESLPNAPRDFDERIRDILTIWADKIDDYARRDYYELVRFYYRPRFGAVLALMRSKMDGGLQEVADAEIVSACRPVEQAWVRKGFRVAKSDRYAKGPTAAAAEVLRKE